MIACLQRKANAEMRVPGHTNEGTVGKRREECEE